jgi:NAD(P)-dependent dehydrogenase (short-subunit alcohol dehydrogenase family)
MFGDEIAGATALVTGASRGFGRGIATALIGAGAHVTLSSGAALFGSPLSGGYAGAKATIRWLTAYAAEESARDKLGIRFVSLLPQLTPETALGAVFAAAYAARQGADAAASRRGPGPALTPEHAGQAVIDLVTADGYDQDAYVLTSAGLRPLN